jgi:hypothetical protein
LKLDFLILCILALENNFKFGRFIFLIQIGFDFGRTEPGFWGVASNLNDYICISMASHFICCHGHPPSLNGSRHNGKKEEMLVVLLFKKFKYRNCFEIKISPWTFEVRLSR